MMIISNLPQDLRAIYDAASSNQNDKLSDLIRASITPISLNGGISSINKLRDLKRIATSEKLTNLDNALQPFIQEFYNAVIFAHPQTDFRGYHLSRYGFDPTTAAKLYLSPIEGI